MVFVSNKVPFPVRSDWGMSRVVGNGTAWVVKTIFLILARFSSLQWKWTNWEKLIVHLHWLVKTIHWFLLLTRCHFQPLVTFGHSWLEMAPRERQKPFHFLHTSDGKQILISIQIYRGFGHQGCTHLRPEWPSFFCLESHQRPFFSRTFAWPLIESPWPCPKL